jgi:hypothetical protein
MYQEWLGPSFPPSEKWINNWSQRLRDDEDAGLEALTDGLRKQRKALYPDYDENLTYDEIASPWRGFFTQQWGTTTPDETSPEFQKLLKLNDTEEGAKYMRKRGLAVGNEKVMNDAVAGLSGNINQIQREV